MKSSKPKTSDKSTEESENPKKSKSGEETTKKDQEENTTPKEEEETKGKEEENLINEFVGEISDSITIKGIKVSENAKRDLDLDDFFMYSYPTYREYRERKGSENSSLLIAAFFFSYVENLLTYTDYEFNKPEGDSLSFYNLLYSGEKDGQSRKAEILAHEIGKKINRCIKKKEEEEGTGWIDDCFDKNKCELVALLANLAEVKGEKKITKMKTKDILKFCSAKFKCDINFIDKIEEKESRKDHSKLYRSDLKGPYSFKITLIRKEGKIYCFFKRPYKYGEDKTSISSYKHLSEILDGPTKKTKADIVDYLLNMQKEHRKGKKKAEKELKESQNNGKAAKEAVNSITNEYVSYKAERNDLIHSLATIIKFKIDLKIDQKIDSKLEEKYNPKLYPESYKNDIAKIANALEDLAKAYKEKFDILIGKSSGVQNIASNHEGSEVFTSKDKHKCEQCGKQDTTLILRFGTCMPECNINKCKECILQKMKNDGKTSIVCCDCGYFTNEAILGKLKGMQSKKMKQEAP